MSDLKPAIVPDIGNYKDVPVIEILVQIGDVVKKDQGLLTLESDKATMEVPAPFAGTVREIELLANREFHYLLRILEGSLKGKQCMWTYFSLVDLSFS